MDLSQALEIVSCTDPGMVRSHNEDSIASDATSGLVVLADGMGGYNAGEVASGIATTVITTELKKLFAKVRPFDVDPETNCDGRFAHGARAGEEGEHVDLPGRAEPAAVRGHGHDARRRASSTTTRSWSRTSATRACTAGAATISARSRATIRCCRSRSIPGLITAEQAKHAHHKNLVTRALGIDPSVDPEIQEYDAAPGDIYLLCSDGLVRHGERRRHRHHAARTRREPRARRPAAGADGQRQRRARQRIGYTRSRCAGVSRAARRGRQAFRVVKIAARVRSWRN
jgi:protein phosphatase